MADEAVTWSIVGGADAARFEISGSTLRWTGDGTKNLEAPDDADTDNAYVVQVRATDAATNVANQTITVTVTNVVEAPVLLTAPAVTPTSPEEGVELTSTPGTWTGDVATYSYEWHRVTGTLPSNSAAPTVSGTTETGSSLSCTTGTWAGDPTITYSYQWKRAPSTPIGTDLASYMLVSGDVGFSILCTVTATNPVGSVPQDSNTVGPITAPATAPSLSGLPPVITGTVAIGASLTCSTGTWAGTPTITYSYQWKRGVTNVGTDSSSYTLVSGDAGSQISCVVTATNGVGSASATADAVGPVPTPTTWSPAHVGANLVLSGGNLTITEVTVDATRQSHIRGTSSRSSPDKRYFEITLVAWSGGDNWGFGLSDSSGPAGDTLAGSSIVGTSNSKGFILEYTGRVKAETAIAAVFVPAPVAGDVFGFACNLSTNEVWVRKNGTWLNGDPVAGSGGISWGSAALDAMYPYFTARSLAADVSITLNAGGAAFGAAVPTGFVAWG